MRFFRLTREKPTTGLITIRPDDDIKVVNASSIISLILEFSTTDGLKESFQLVDEITLQNSSSYLKRSYFRLEIMIADPKALSYSDEVHCKLAIE